MLSIYRDGRAIPMAVSQTVAPAGTGIVSSGDRADVSADARMAGGGLLLAIASVILLYAGSGVIAGTRPGHAVDGATVASFYDHTGLTLLFFQAAIGVLGLVFFAIAFRRYALAFATTPGLRQLLEFGVVLVLLEAPVLIVELGLQLSLVQLARVADPSLFGVFQAWDWLDNGTMLVLEIGWLIVISAAAWASGSLPRWIAGFGLLVGLLMSLLALPSLPLAYPDGVTLVAYGPFILWFIVTGTYLARGGTTPQA